MRFYNRTTSNPPTWSRGTVRGSTSQLSQEAGARPMFSNPLDDEVYDTRFDRRQPEQMSTLDSVPTDKSIGGEDA